MKKKIRSTCVSFAGVVLVGCAHDPIIIDIQTKVPLIEASVLEYKKPLVHQQQRKRSISLEQSQQRTREKKARVLQDAAMKMQRLSLEIELLTLENERIRQKTKYQSQYQNQYQSQNRSKRLIKPNVSAPQLQVNSSQVAPVTLGLSRDYLAIQKSVVLKKTEINQSLEVLSSQSLQFQQNSSLSKISLLSKLSSSTTNTALLSPQVNTSVPKNKVLFHVVYVLPDKNAWQDLWGRLETSGVVDKWRGRNKAKGVYFIYVGSYAGEHYATRRKASLKDRLGEAPMVVSALKNVSLASLMSLVEG